MNIDTLHTILTTRRTRLRLPFQLRDKLKNQVLSLNTSYLQKLAFPFVAVQVLHS